MGAKALESLDPDAELAAATTVALRATLAELRRQHDESYYYMGLAVFEAFSPPTFSAWSWEALKRTVASDPNPEHAFGLLKWSCADSPYCGFGARHFERVCELVYARPDPYSMSDTESQAEYDRRMAAYESALRQVDSEGAFGSGEARIRTAALLEVLPPDGTNLAVAKRLNPPGAIADWLAEAEG